MNTPLNPKNHRHHQPFWLSPLVVLALLALACNSLSGLAGATPTVWVLAPTISPPTMSVPVATVMVSPSSNGNPQEVSILKCQNKPSTGIVPAKTPIVLVWGWATDNETKRDEIISISSFIVEVDGKAQDTGRAERILESTNTVFWKLSIGQLSPGTHEIKLTQILARDFAESSGTLPAGRQGEEICELVVQE
jgi:hypothetical protein